jgi:hypothetical protein
MNTILRKVRVLRASKFDSGFQHGPCDVLGLALRVLLLRRST